MKMTIYFRVYKHTLQMFLRSARVHTEARSARTMSGTRLAPLLTVQPSRGLVDEKFQIVVRNLPPAKKVTLHSLHHSEDKDLWEAFGHYISNEKGTVTAAEDASVGGTYEGIEPMGLLWSMRPIPGSRKGLRLRKKDVTSPIVVHISVYEDHISQGFVKQEALACDVVERWYMAPGVRRIDVREQGVRGTLFMPPGPGLFPGILDLWGGGGGLVEYRSALLASLGFASMALEYLGAEDSIATDLGLGYFETALQCLRDHPLVAANRVALLGLSFGTTVSLSLAAYSEVAQPTCCVCISGSHACPVKGSFTTALKSLQENFVKTRIDENNCIIWRDVLLPITTDPDLKVEVGRIKCPLMLINGQDDQNWATVESAEDIQKMMEEAGNSHLLTVLSYPDAGHLIEPPYSPHTRASNFILQHTKEKIILLWGGHTKPHADAQEDAWKKIVEFLKLHLFNGQDSAPLARL